MPPEVAGVDFAGVEEGVDFVPELPEEPLLEPESELDLLESLGEPEEPEEPEEPVSFEEPDEPDEPESLEEPDDDPEELASELELELEDDPLLAFSRLSLR